MKFATSTLAAALLLVITPMAHAGGRDDLIAFTKGLKGLDGQFTQQVFDPRGKHKERSSGRVALAAPRLFRWEYVKPYPQLIVADGKTVWVFDPDLQQVSKRPQGAEEASSPLTILIDPKRLDRDFIVTEKPAKDGLQWLDVKPRKAGDAAFRSAQLGFGKTGLARMHFVDALGQRTEIGFSSWKRNPVFARGTFAYAPAKGVDVIGS